MVFNLLLTFQKLNVEKRFVFQSLKTRAFNILYNLWNSAESNLENAVNGISGVLDFKQANLVWPILQPVLVCLPYGNETRPQIQRCLSHPLQIFYTLCKETLDFLKNVHHSATRTLRHQLYHLNNYQFYCFLAFLKVDIIKSFVNTVTYTVGGSANVFRSYVSRADDVDAPSFRPLVRPRQPSSYSRPRILRSLTLHWRRKGIQDFFLQKAKLCGGGVIQGLSRQSFH